MATTNNPENIRRALDGIGCPAHPTPVLCAVSGGLDSMCLLDMAAARWDLRVTAAHFNHHLRPTADRDEDFVRTWCHQRGIPAVFGGGDVLGARAQSGASLEEAARELRYAFLLAEQKRLGCVYLLTAHHADDNAETILLNLLRGTGLRGLTGIPPCRDGILRPLLGVTRRELEDYAAARGIPHVEDETNQTDDAARNVLRHQVLPVLKALNPRAVENLCRTAGILRADETALEAEAQALCARCHVRPGEWAELPLALCRDVSGAVLCRVVQALLSQVGGHRRDVAAVHVEAALSLREKPPGKAVSLPYGMTAARTPTSLRFTLRTALPSASLVPGRPVSWGRYTLTLLDAPSGPGLSLAAGGAVTAAPCPPEGRLTLPGSRGARTVKRLCLDRRISLEERAALPGFYVDGRLAAVWPLGVDVEFLPEGGACRFIQIIKRAEEKHDEK